jgi:hypothetical protein
MKNIRFLLFVALLGCLSFSANAQFGRAASFPLVAGDTLTNTDTVAKVITATAGYSASGIQVNLTKLSGTVAGKAYLYQSLDGINYVVTDSASYTTLSTTTPSIQSPSVTATAMFSKNPVPSVYYEVVATSSGTVSMVCRVLYTLRKYTGQVTTQ